ncbi:MAG: response regulator [Bacteroidota bacterium]
MNERLKCILLVDDDDATNYMHKRIIVKSRCVERVEVCKSAEEALQYLANKANGQCPSPEIIFLDINMPGMNGWEFFEVYDKLDVGQKADVVIVTLTTPLLPKDQEKAKKVPYINGFAEKPLSKEKLDQIIGDFFPDLSVI